MRVVVAARYTFVEKVVHPNSEDGRKCCDCKVHRKVVRMIHRSESLMKIREEKVQQDDFDQVSYIAVHIEVCLLFGNECMSKVKGLELQRELA